MNRALAAGQVTIDGVPAHRSIGDIDEQVDLAVVAVPADRVPEAVADCGEHGVQGLVVLSAGYAEWGAEGRERQRELVRQARSYGMRIIGPNAFGLINNAETVRLNASLAPEPPAPGRIGLFTQSGAIGIALLSGLYRRGAGLSTFISAGNRADISGNDFLQYWYEDPDTDVALLYLESLGNPRKFTRLARRTAAVKPVVVVKGARHSGSTPPGHAVPISRIPDATVSALMRQAGVIRVDTVTEMVDAGLLLADQPLPAGPRVAILGNSESLGLLTYDACLAEGLRPRPPLDLTTAATPQDFRNALAEALADDGCDSVVVTAIPWVGEDGEAESGDGEVLAAALHTAAAAGPAKPVAVVHVEIGGLAEALAAATSTVAQPRPTPAPTSTPDPPSVRTAPPEPGPASAAPLTSAPGTRNGRIPAYPAAERAVRALAEAVRYAQWRRQAAVPGKVPEFLDDTIDEPGTAALIDTLLGPDPDPRGLQLVPDQARELLGHYGITVRPTLPASDPDAAVAAAARLGYPVALKTTAPHLRHRADLGGVRLDLANETALRRAYGELTDLLGKPAELQPVVQSMAPRGVDTVVRATIDPAAGAVLSFGLAGAPSNSSATPPTASSQPPTATPPS